ncbi:hypothetical protein, partial [Proteus mirabilis]|uniref:hypothetical protein n=1 Tax=Proteus mirabilis TaxID=584 RepID=UPI00003DC0BE
NYVALKEKVHIQSNDKIFFFLKYIQNSMRNYLFPKFTSSTVFAFNLLYEINKINYSKISNELKTS